MQTIQRLWSAALLLLLAACSAVSTSPSAEVRQALAPTGTLRIAVYPGSPTSMVIDPVSKEVRGVSVEIGKELAQRLGVPYRLVEYQRVAQVVDGLKTGAADFTITNATPERVNILDFTTSVLSVELGYLVPAGSTVASFAELDKPGARIGVSQGSTTFGTLSRELKHAELVQAPNLQAAVELLAQHKVDAYATNKGVLFQMSDSLPGARVLNGRWGLEHFSVGIPKGRDAGLEYLRKFVEEANKAGLFIRAAERAGLRGTVSVDAS